MVRQKSPKAEQALAASRDRVRARLEAAPRVAYPSELPFTQRVDEIKQAVVESQVVVISGETGSGKSTQIPKLCLELGLGASGLIGHTQPRRLAARSVASRIAEELKVTLGQEVGSKVRFSDQTSDRTFIKVMTDGMLLAESRSDRLLEQYNAIIVDEAHERSLNVDFLLGILSRVLPRRPDLKLVITSATIDPERFADHYQAVLGLSVPIIEVSGRTFPVETIYQEPIDEQGHALELPDAVALAAETLAVKDGFGPAGDVLVFLPGEREIRDVARVLRRKCEATRLLAGTEIVPLYARLSFAEQQRVFRRAPHRRIVLATNVAETSLTVPGIRYVIDSGVARVNRYSPRRRVQSLQVEAISQASARQRAGRCGRTEPGTCIRLFSEDDHDRRDAFTAPEIQRTNLSGVILQMSSLKLGDPRAFPFIEPPESRRITEAYDTLFELGAVDQQQKLTEIGRQMARLPVDPRLARILIAAKEEGALAEALIIASALEVQDPRERPADARDAADAKHQRFADNASDFITLINLWDHYHKEKERLSRSQLRKQCVSEFINAVRMHEWTDTHRQLREQCRDLGWKVSKRMRPVDREALHRSILTGCLTTVGKRHEDGGFVSPIAGVFHVHPGSSVKAKGSSWLVAPEIVRTTRLYARLCARIEGAWVEELAAHLIRKEYSDASYVPERGRVEASAKVTFGQIEISRGRQVDYGAVDRADARSVFVREALVEGGLRTGAKYESHNRHVLDELHEREAKVRKSFVPSDETLCRFYADRIGEDVSTAKGFDKWRRRAERDNPRVLFMSPESIEYDPNSPTDDHSHPSHIRFGREFMAELVYRLEPGSERDGIEAKLIVSDAAQASPEQFDWLIPAWLPEKVEAVLRGLPKVIRRQYDPSELTSKVMAQLRYQDGDFYSSVAREASRLTGLSISPQACRDVPLPAHLRMRGVLFDEHDGEIASGHDFSSLIGVARKQDAKNRKDVSRAPLLTAWPNTYPAIDLPLGLVDAGDGVRLLEHADAVAAEVQHWFGVRRLAAIQLRTEVQRLLKHTPHVDRAAVQLQTIEGTGSLVDEVASIIPEVDRPAAAKVPRRRDEYEAYVERCKDELGTRTTRAIAVIASILEARQAAAASVEGILAANAELAQRDIQFQLRQLVHGGTFRRSRWTVLTRMPAYLKGIRVRIEKLRGDGIVRDRAAMSRVSPHWTRCIQRAQEWARIGRESRELEQYRWMVEELRLNLFAPNLAARKAASEKMLDKLWDEIERGV